MAPRLELLDFGSWIPTPRYPPFRSQILTPDHHLQTSDFNSRSPLLDLFPTVLGHCATTIFSQHWPQMGTPPKRGSSDSLSLQCCAPFCIVLQLSHIKEKRRKKKNLLQFYYCPGFIPLHPIWPLHHRSLPYLVWAFAPLRATCLCAFLCHWYDP